MEIRDVLKIIKAVNKGFGGVVKSVYLSEGKCWFDSSYLVGSFVVEGLVGFGSSVVELKIDEVELLFRDDVSVRVEDKVVVFDKGGYVVKVVVVGSVVDRVGSVDISGEEVELDDIVMKGFDLSSLLSENVMMLMDSCVVMDNKVIIINPVWVCVGRVGYGGERLEVSKGLLLSGKDLRGSGVKVVLGKENLFLKFGSGVVGIGRRQGVKSDILDRVMSKLVYDESLLSDIKGLEWLKDWGKSDEVIIWCDSDGRIVGGEVYRGSVGVEGGIDKGVAKYRVGEKFVSYLNDSDAGVVVNDRVLWVRKGDMDLYIGVSRL